MKDILSEREFKGYVTLDRADFCKFVLFLEANDIGGMEDLLKGHTPTDKLPEQLGRQPGQIVPGISYLTPNSIFIVINKEDIDEYDRLHNKRRLS